MTPSDPDKSIDDDATFDGVAKPPASSRDASLGDERTLRCSGIAIDDTLLDNIEIVDLDAHYKVVGGLGERGMGAVVLATDTRLGRRWRSSGSSARRPGARLRSRDS